MATYANPTNQIAALKELYSGDSFMKDLVYKKQPFMALVPKNESPQGMAGKYMPVPMTYGAPQGRSNTFATAQTNQTAPSLASFFVYRTSNYQIASITNELLEATSGDAGAFVSEAKLVMDTAIRNITNDIAYSLFNGGAVYSYRGSYGASGGSGSISTGVITLDNPQDVVQFEVGMVLVSYSVSGSTPTQSTSAASGYVIAVNRSAGTVTVSATAGGAAGNPTSWSTSFPYLAVSGDINFVSGGLSTANALKITGLGAWLPSTAPSASENFWGVDRSVDSRLYGQIVNGSSESIEEALIDGVSQIAREGGDPDMVFINFTSYAALEKSLGAKVQYVSVKHDQADIAFKAIQLNGPYGELAVIPDRNVQNKRAYILQMDTFQLRSLGKSPHVLTYGMEGLEALRVGTADALEIRIGMYGNLICSAPGWNATVSLSQ